MLRGDKPGSLERTSPTNRKFSKGGLGVRIAESYIYLHGNLCSGELSTKLYADSIVLIDFLNSDAFTG